MNIEFDRSGSGQPPTYEKGEVLHARVEAMHPFGKYRATLLGLEGEASVYAPDKDPENVAADRAAPDATAALTYEDAVGYIAAVPTAALAPAGDWTLRVHLSAAEVDGLGAFDIVLYRTFTLRE